MRTRYDKKFEHYKRLSEKYKLKPFTGKPPPSGFPSGVSPWEFFALKAESIDNQERIMSDNPDSLELLQFKIDSVDRLSLFFKSCNKSFKCTGEISSIRLTPHWQEVIEKNIKETGKPFSKDYFNRLRQRKDYLKKRIAKIESGKFFNSMLINNISIKIIEGQIVVTFPKKPHDDILKALKASPLRLKWSRYRKSWVRKFTGQGEDYFNALKTLLLKVR